MTIWREEGGSMAGVSTVDGESRRKVNRWYVWGAVMGGSRLCGEEDM